jgi:hypothetical protein
MSHHMYRLLASIVSPPFKHLLPCYVEGVIMAMVKASTPPCWELSYDLGVVHYMEIDELEKLHDCKSRGGHWQKFRKPCARKYRLDFIQDT